MRSDKSCYRIKLNVHRFIRTFNHCMRLKWKLVYDEPKCWNLAALVIKSIKQKLHGNKELLKSTFLRAGTYTTYIQSQHYYWLAQAWQRCLHTAEGWRMIKGIDIKNCNDVLLNKPFSLWNHDWALHKFTTNTAIKLLRNSVRNTLPASNIVNSHIEFG